MGHNPETQRRSRMRLRRKAIDYLGGRCAVCGEGYHVVLEFDHINPIKWVTSGLKKINGQQNTNDINRMIKNGEEPKDVFQLLCANCHKIKTHENKDFLTQRETNNGRKTYTR